MVDNGYGDVAFILNHPEEYREVTDLHWVEQQAKYVRTPFAKRIILESTLDGFNQLASDTRKQEHIEEAKRLVIMTQSLAEDLCL